MRTSFIPPSKLRTKYRDVLPPLPLEEREALRANIELMGIQTPIAVLCVGKGEMYVLDGHQRLDIARELKHRHVPYVVTDLRGIDPELYILGLHLSRRHLTNEQKRELIERQIRRFPRLTPYTLAQRIGVSDKTVTKYRDTMPDLRNTPTIDKRGHQWSPRNARSGSAPRRTEDSNCPYSKKQIEAGSTLLRELGLDGARELLNWLAERTGRRRVG
jgi:hypothetical protein